MNSSKVLKNAGWIIACRIMQAVLQLVVSMMTARYLGPSNYGVINYAASLVAFVTPIMQLGLNFIVVQEVVKGETSDGEIIGTALTMCLASAGLCILGVIAFSTLANTGEITTIVVCALYSISLLFQSFEIIQYWFQAKLLSKYASIISLVAYFGMSIYKIYILATAKSIYWFAVSNAIDYLLIGLGMIILFKCFSKGKLRFSRKTASRMFQKSRYYIVSALMVTVFAQTDRVMLKLMIGDSAAGLYSAAVACTGMTGFVFSAIIDSARPSIFESKNLQSVSYEHNIILLYSIIIYMALCQSIVITSCAKPIVSILYGEAYLDAVPALQIVVWYTAFSYLGSARNIWILAENKQNYLWMINLSGALMNVLLNFLSIPKWGIVGAAAASLITQIFTNFFVSYIIRPISYNNMLILRSLNPKHCLELANILLFRKQK